MPLALICDFDGTIVNVDTGELILSKFAKGDWRSYDRLYDRGKTPMAEVMRQQFSMVRATKNSMIESIEGLATLRPGFDRLLQHCSREHIPFAVVSYGLDFCIKHVLNSLVQEQRVTIYAPRARATPNGIGFTFPRLHTKDSVNLKDDVVRLYGRRGYKTAFVGDGFSDFPAIKEADLRFAIKGSKLAELCRRDGVHALQIDRFDQVIEEISLSSATP